MAENSPRFSEEQWSFLGVLAVIGEPVSIELAGILAPLLPGPLVDLLIRAEASGWLIKIGQDRLRIEGNLPGAVKHKLRSIQTHEYFGTLVDRIQAEKLADKIGTDAMIRLLDGAGKSKEASEIEFQLAQTALKNNASERGRSYFLNSIARLQNCSDDPESGALLLAVTLQLSNLSFAQGKGLAKIDGFLQKAHEVAAQLGDKRSHALINFHLGRLYYFTDRREDAMVALSLGAQEMESLGDEDIWSQSAIFLGLYYFNQGLYREAFEHLEKANRLFETTEMPFLEHSMTPLFAGYCAIYLGQFHSAIGSLDYCWRRARERSDKAMASLVGAVLGLVLVLIKKPNQASIHLQQALNDAKEVGNALGLYFCGGAMALQHFIDGRIREAYDVLKRTIIDGSGSGLVRQFSSPWILNMLYEFHRLEFEPIPDFDYHDVIERVLNNGINCHLQGVALRLRAKDHLIRGSDYHEIKSLLEQSEAHLRKSGDPVELSMTLLEMARLELRDGNGEKARDLAHNARHVLGGYIEEFFPGEFLHLLENHSTLSCTTEGNDGLFEKYLEMIESLYPIESRADIMNKALSATSRLFGAERCGLFWFPDGRHTSKPEFRAASSLSLKEVTAKTFRSSLDMVITAHKTNTPQVGTLQVNEITIGGKKVIRSVLCIPIEDQGLVHGVLFYDNSYSKNAFEFIDLSLAKRLATHTHKVMERRFNHLKTQEQVNILTSENVLRQESGKKEIVTQSSNMLRLLEQIDQIAETDSTILLTGETGTGKELFAKRIQEKSTRAAGPFIVVDATTIPENLLESELFGHEKGAFTGAENRKIGRIEMANHGTLFLDEVGELTYQAQTKLLRALQEKTFNRVGGIKTINSDFRLITATNRDLMHEVVQRRFREDLYYRLNVVPIHLPPLRERGKDPVLLAKHFITLYAKKYNRPFLELSSEDERLLLAYEWPGNIRELKNVIERAIILSKADRLELAFPAQRDRSAADPFSDRPSLDEIQRRYIRFIVRQTGGKVSGPGGAADILGMKRTSLYTRMKALGIKKR